MFRGLFLCLVVVLFCMPVRAQKILEAELGVNGLTCSQCSRSVELSLRRLGFIKNVTMDLEHTQGRLLFKDNERIDPEAIAQAVKDAGFSVRSLELIFLFSDIQQSSCFNANGFSYQLVQTAPAMQGKVTLQVLGSAFQPKKEYKSWQPLLKSNCHVAEKVYFVTAKAGKI